MHIAINTSPLQSNHKLRGIGSYTKELIEALQKYEGQHSYSFFTRTTEIPKNADIVHYPFFDPFFLTLHLSKPRPVVVTVHDLIPLSYPKHFRPGIRGWVKWYIQRLSLTGVQAVMADSNASKQEIERLVNIPSERLFVVPLAPSDRFRPVTDRKALEVIREKYQLPEQFLLYVGDVNWNKNVAGLINAYSNIKYQISNIKYKDQKSKIGNLKLVLVGRAFVDKRLKEAKEISQLIDSLKLKNEVIKLGLVAEEDLPAIYSLATLYVQPSLAEGFGLPVLEAMACGTPVVCSNRSSLVEIAGPARLVDPENPYEMAEAVISILSLTPTERKKLVDKGFAWVKNFSWQRVACETKAVYEAVFPK